jgi:hypothetical protein
MKNFQVLNFCFFCFKTKEELHNFIGHKAIIMNSNTKGFLIFIAVFCILLVLGDIFLWVNITNGYTEAQYQSAYLDRYPEQVRSLMGLSIIPLLLLVFASFIFIRSAKTNFVKVTAATIATVFAIIIIWKMFTLL